MQISVNGDIREVVDGVSLSELISTLALASERIAVELNHSVVRRAEWDRTTLTEGDRVEIVHFVGGGS